jgi:hypothetical protein
VLQRLKGDAKSSYCEPYFLEAASIHGKGKINVVANSTLFEMMAPTSKAIFRTP